MELLPTATRELRLAARRSRTYSTRVGFNALAILVVFGLLSPSFAGVRSPAETGQFLFLALSAVAFFLSLISGAFMTADALSEEKREGTLGLLFLTDLRGHDVVLGKLVGKGLNPFYALISVLPLLALPMIIGGVTPGEFFRMSLVLLNTMFFSLTLALAASAISVASRRAWALTMFTLAALSGIPWMLVYLTGSSPFAIALTQFSPVFGWLTSMDSQYGSNESIFWSSLGFIHFLGWASLLAACAAAPRFWQDFAPNPRQAEWQRRWRIWLLGSDQHQI
ncbi:MAG: ABC transporter permease subunit, partial [Opitutaceae bacterium]|nr:ABC transporter permease subunit [Verrucomicrobiales bacterium]